MSIGAGWHWRSNFINGVIVLAEIVSFPFNDDFGFRWKIPSLAIRPRKGEWIRWRCHDAQRPARTAWKGWTRRKRWLERRSRRTGRIGFIGTTWTRVSHFAHFDGIHFSKIKMVFFAVDYRVNQESKVNEMKQKLILFIDFDNQISIFIPLFCRIKVHQAYQDIR